MHDIKTHLLSSSGLALLASLVVSLGCSSSSNAGAAGASSGGTSSGGTTANGGTDTTGGSGTATAGSGTGGSGTATGGTSMGGSATATGGSSGATPGGGATSVGGSNDGNAGAAGHVGAGGNLRITLLGDSTTSDGCFRAHLAQLLTAGGHANFTYVGTRSGNPNCVGAFPLTNEGHGGYIVADILKATSTGRPGGADPTDPYTSSASDLALWFDGKPTDVVLMNFGTNDLSNNIPAATIINAYTAILTKLRAVNPNVRMLVAEIPPIAWQFCTFPVCDPRVKALNAAIVTWAGQQSTAQSPVVPVDQYTGYDDATDTVDGVHANESGSVKLANNWYNAVLPAF